MNNNRISYRHELSKFQTDYPNLFVSNEVGMFVSTAVELVMNSFINSLVKISSLDYVESENNNNNATTTPSTFPIKPCHINELLHSSEFGQYLFKNSIQNNIIIHNGGTLEKNIPLKTLIDDIDK
jgi:hypothetical protein